MRIDDLNRSSLTQGAGQSEQVGQQAKGKDALQKDGAAGSDQVQVSHLAKSLAGPDPGRIEQLRLQVESGNYEVSAQALAKALINAHVKE